MPWPVTQDHALETERAAEHVVVSAVGVRRGRRRPAGPHDGPRNPSDFLILLAEWCPCSDPCPRFYLGDIDEDCDVGINDLLLLLANWT